MKKLSKRAVAALTNFVLVFILAIVSTVCFLPSVSGVAGVNERVHYKGAAAKGVSLMFNVYWGTEEVYGILNVLDEYNAKATFFIGGSWADDNTACLKEIASRGHELGSHGYFHRDHSKMDFAANYQEIKTSCDFILQATGKTVTLFAPPSGAYGDDTVKAAQALDLNVILWSKDTVDWRDKDSEVCLRRATKDVAAGDFILMHPMAHTQEALPKILSYYRQNNLQTVTVSENIG